LVSQGTVATFFRYAGQVQKHLSKISPGFCVPTTIQISLFLTKLLKNTMWPFLDTVYTLALAYDKHTHCAKHKTNAHSMACFQGQHGKSAPER